MRQWHYTGDASLEYGGVFIDLSEWEHGYCEAVRITDLDGGCGFTGASEIKHVVINGCDDPKRIEEALRSCGYELHDPNDKMAWCLMVAEALSSYGHYDLDDAWDNYQTSPREIVQIEADGPMVFDGWKADKRLHNTSLRAYVESVHLN